MADLLIELFSEEIPARMQARAAEDTGDIATAGAIYAEIVKHEPENLPAVAGMARSLLAQGQSDAARETLDTVPADKREDADIKSATAALILAAKAGEVAGQAAALEASVAADAPNISGNCSSRPKCSPINCWAELI